MSPNAEEILKVVALAYEKNRTTSTAPRVIAKGEGFMAERILATCEELGIPLYRDADLVEILGALDLGEEIPEELYKVVAEILIFIYRLGKGHPKNR